MGPSEQEKKVLQWQVNLTKMLDEQKTLTFEEIEEQKSTLESIRAINNTNFDATEREGGDVRHEGVLRRQAAVRDGVVDRADVLPHDSARTNVHVPHL